MSRIIRSYIVDIVETDDVIYCDKDGHLTYNIEADKNELVRCKDCRHAVECNKSVQYTRNEPNSVNIGCSQIEWCSRGERKER